MTLVDAEQPLKLADGTLVYPDRVVSPTRAKLVEVPTHGEAQQLVINTRKRLADLPEVPRTLNAISVVISYTLFGLSDEEISIASNLTLAQIENIRTLEAYKTMFDQITGSILEAETNVVREIFVKNSASAAKTLINALSSESEGAQLLAAKEILDRGGHRPADIVEHRHKVDGGLVIEIIRKDNSRQPPTIDVSL